MFDVLQVQPDGVVLQDGMRHLRIQAAGKQILRVNETRRVEFLNQRSDIVLQQGGTSCHVHEDDTAVIVDTGHMSVRCDKCHGKLTFMDAESCVLLDQPKYDGHVMTEIPVMINDFGADAQIMEHQSVDGARADSDCFVPRHDRNAYQLKISFVFDHDEGIYGFGSHEEGYGNLRGRSRILYQHNFKACVPMFVSTKGYGVLFDLQGMAAFHDDADGTYLWADCADELDYYVIGGGSFDTVLANHRLLTGAAPMLPKWAFGYIQSKQRYHSFDELLEVSCRYRKEGVPLDCIVQDWLSWPDSQWGQKSLCPERYPEPEKNIAKLHDMDIHLMLSVWPNMAGNGDNQQEMLNEGCMLGNRSTYNAFDPKARSLYWKQANEGLFSKGIDAWWCDCTEPFEADWNGDVRLEPHEQILKNTHIFKKYLDPAKINAYSLFHSRGIYEGQRAVSNEKRVVNLTRSSYAGQHRYATITWSGDVSAKWETLRRQVPEGCNFTATGEPFWSTDAGAFFVKRGRQWFWQGDFDRGVDDLGYRELYVRWLWYNAYLPMMRSHGDDTPREIWQFGKPGEPYYEAIKAAIERRYSLLPYFYSLCAQVNRTGAAMLKAPALAFPQDAVLRSTVGETAMIVGDNLYVRPVTEPMEYGPDSEPIEGHDHCVDVYLPSGTAWYDYDTAQYYIGGQTIRAEAPLSHIPTFVRAGTILPTAPVAASTAAQCGLPITVTVYPGQDGVFELYDDAGDGYGYEHGEFTCIPISWNDRSHTLTIGERKGNYPTMPKVQQFKVALPEGLCALLDYDGTEQQVKMVSLKDK